MGITWSRVLSWIVALVIGAAYGTAGTIAHSYRVGRFPVGLILAIIGVAALLIAIRALTDDRWGTFFCGVGLVAATVVFSGTGPGGSVIVPSGKLDSIGVINLGVVWTVIVPILTLAAVLWPFVRGNRVPASN